ncbi:HNH endonuclease signature motif containing protein [Brevibacillus laterosporus]|uniref:HNH endonuclease signature motif containing protein n=1 Tax=Brevibacillus laterosporus TaxID=1465 RepID=UPI003D1DC16D
MALKKFCRKQGCSKLTENRYCDAHKSQTKLYNQERGTAAKRGYDARWRKARAGYLAGNPLCKKCLEKGKIIAATVVDHITPHKGDVVLFWDRNNWQGLCASCHSRKTAKEDGGFGNGKIPERGR